MAGPEEIEWVTRLNRQLEPFQHAGQRLARSLEPLIAAWRQFEAARDRGDFRHFQIRLWLMGWMVQHIMDAKANPTHRKARVWLQVMHLTPGQIEGLLGLMLLDEPDLRIPSPKGRPRRIAKSTLAMAEELGRRIKDTGELPTTAAKRLLTDKGFRGQTLKDRADHLVKVWRNRVLKSR